MKNVVLGFTYYVSHTYACTHIQSAMASMTEVLAQAVYGLSLTELPLEHLASTPHRYRSHSTTGRPEVSTRPTSRQEIAHPRLSSFSNILSIHPPARHSYRKICTGVVTAPTGSTVNPSASQRRGLGSSVPPASSHPTPTSSSPQHSNHPRELTPIKEQASFERTKLSLSEEEEEKERREEGKENFLMEPLVCDSKNLEEEENRMDDNEERPNEIIANPNTAEPSPSSSVGHTPGASQESLGAVGIDPAQPLLGMPNHGECSSSKKSLLSATTSLFKHKSPEAKHKKKKTRISSESFGGGGGSGSGSRGGGNTALYSPLLAYDEDEEKARKKEKTAHKRSGSDTTSHSVVKGGSPSLLIKSVTHPQDKGSSGRLKMASTNKRGSVVETTSNVKKEWKRPFYMRKSSSDGNIHSLSLSLQFYNHPLPGTSDDSEGHPVVPFCRMNTIGSPVPTSESSSVQDISSIEASPVGLIAAVTVQTTSGASTSTGAKRTHKFKRAKTIDPSKPAGVECM